MKMKTMKTKTILLASAAALPLVPAVAQQADKDSTLNRTVVVENQYHPEVMDAFKVNVLPKVEEPQVAKTHIDYATSLRPLGVWQGAAMPPITGSQVQPDAPRGYVRAAYGNRNNTDVRLSYLASLSVKDQLGIMGSFYGMSGKVPTFDEGKEWESRFFRGDASIDYRHDFSRVSLRLGGDVGVQNFNYMPARLDNGTSSQRFMSGQGYVGIASRQGQCPIDFDFQTGIQLFGIQHDLGEWVPSSETKVHTVGWVAADLAEDQRVGIGFALDNLFYSEKEGEKTDTWKRELKNYSLLQLNPYYTYVNGGLKARLGAHVDTQMGNNGGLKVAPDVALDYTFSTSYTLYVHAGGGTVLNDYRRLNELSPYHNGSLQPVVTYSPLDVEAGLKASPATGWDFRLFGGYKILKDDVFLTGTDVWVGEWSEATPLWKTCLYEQGETKAAFGGAELNGSYKGWFNLSLRGVYYDWQKKDDTAGSLWLKPQFTLDASLRARILPDLHAGIRYQYEQRALPYKDAPDREDPVSNLCLNADYQLFQRVNVFIQLNNLLDKDYITTQGYPTQGFHALAGISCRL